MIIYVDIDETICFYEGERHYPDAVPHNENISKINKLYDDGNEITYWTAVVLSVVLTGERQPKNNCSRGDANTIT